MIRDYNLLCLSETISPLTHCKGVVGNEALIMREPVVTPRGVQWVPCLSGNAVRHRLVREPGARWLVGRLGLAGELTLSQLNYLFHGGNLTEGGGRENTRRIADMQRIFPLQRLLGGSLPDQIIPGSLLCWRGLLACEENRAALTAHLPVGWSLPEQSLRPAESFVSGYTYTRGDSRKGEADLLGDVDDEAASNLMIFSGQQVTRGAAFLHGFTLQHTSELALGALLLSLRLWQQSGGTIGGQGARGHGRLQTFPLLPEGVDGEAAVAAYVAHTDAHREEAVRWLQEAFAPRAKKSKKEAASAAGAT